MKITDLCELKHYKGEVGIEIEVEGNNLPAEGPLGWRKEEDGSLRGECGEFVLERPCSRNSVGMFLSRIYSAYEESGTTVLSSPRQSVHVHINVQDVSAEKIFNFILLFLIFEPLLVSFCGEGRSNNLFCLRASDAEYLLSTLENAAENGSLYDLSTETLRYSAINVNALFKYGSLEFRSMRGATDQQTLEQWVGMLLKLKDFAVQLDTPKDLMKMFKSVDTFSFAQSVFGEYTHLLYNHESHGYLLQSARSVKMIAYLGDWDKLSEEQPDYTSSSHLHSADIEAAFREVGRSRMQGADNIPAPPSFFIDMGDEDREEEEEERELDDDDEGVQW